MTCLVGKDIIILSHSYVAYAVSMHIQTHKMPRAPSPSIPEKEFLFNALKQSLRLDGRQALEMREPKLTFGADLGYVECSLGKTR